MEKDLCRGLYTSLFCVIIPTLFPYFLQFWYPYILLHFKCFLLLVLYIASHKHVDTEVSKHTSYSRRNNCCCACRIILSGYSIISFPRLPTCTGIKFACHALNYVYGEMKLGSSLVPRPPCPAFVVCSMKSRGKAWTDFTQVSYFHGILLSPQLSFPRPPS